MGIAFRCARLEDAAHLVGLVEELGYPSAPSVLRVRLARLLAEGDQGVFVAVESETTADEAAQTLAHAPLGRPTDEILGWVHVQEFLSLAGDPTGLVTGLVVSAVARRRGIGRGLMAAAEGWARARGLASMRLRARVARSAAHAFYQRLGYTLAKKQLQFRKELR